MSTVLAIVNDVDRIKTLTLLSCESAVAVSSSTERERVTSRRRDLIGAIMIR